MDPTRRVMRRIMNEVLDPEELQAVRAIASGHEPFQEWFDKDPNKIDDHRVLLGPFTASIENIRLGQDLEILKDVLENNGYTDIDLANGRAKRGNRQYRVGRILSRAPWEFKLEIFRQYVEHNPFVIDTGWDSEADDFKPVEETPEAVEKVAKYLEQKFQNRKIPRTDTPYHVLISNDPVDIARMSEDRGWTSCQNIKYASDPYFEIACGGIIAYIVPEDYQIDPEQGIMNPVARIHLRNAMRINKKTEDYVETPVREQSIYGTDVLGNFPKIVDQWIESHGGLIKGTVRELVGSSYSDTYMALARGQGQDPEFGMFGMFDLGDEESAWEGEGWDDDPDTYFRMVTYIDGSEYRRVEVKWDGDFDKDAFDDLEPFQSPIEDVSEVIDANLIRHLSGNLEKFRDWDHASFYKLLYQFRGADGIGYIVIDKEGNVVRDKSPMSKQIADILLGRYTKPVEVQPTTLKGAIEVLNELPLKGTWEYSYSSKEPDASLEDSKERDIDAVALDDYYALELRVIDGNWDLTWEIEDPWAGEIGVPGIQTQGDVISTPNFSELVKALKKHAREADREMAA
jgi:hypothetical protein